MIADYSGVVGRKLKDMDSGKKIIDAHFALIAEKAGVSREEAEKVEERLRRKYDTEVIHYAVRSEYGLMLSEYVGRVYVPFLGDVAAEVRRDRELIAAVRGLRIPKAILSNSVGVYIDTSLKAQGLRRHFEFVMTSDALDAYTKPHEEAYMRTLQRTGFDPETTIYFDNKRSHLKVPHSIGMITVYIGDKPIEDKAHVDYRFDSFTDAMKTLAGQLRR